MKMEKQWAQIGMKPHHGINIPLSSIRTQLSCGIGEFLDLIPLIDFCKKVGFDVIQLLPLNDQGKDCSPYNTLSSCALDPVYLSLHALPDLGDLKDSIRSFHKFLHLKKVVTYEIKQKKLLFLYRYFEKQFPSVSHTSDYQQFFSKNASWLIPYAQFKSLKEQYDGKHWRDWPQETPSFRHLEFYYFLQFLCFQQMNQVHIYAKKQHCFLKGDIPFFVNEDSADVWKNLHLFNCNFVGGCPPDAFNRSGQKWNFPLYEWEEIAKEDYAWWKTRLKVKADLYDIYRLDHIIGFFRVWAIEKTKPILSGQYFPSNPIEQKKQGEKFLQILSDIDALPIAEDLGADIKMVRHTLQTWHICGVRVMRWEQSPKYPKKFIPFDQYDLFSVCTAGTHDMEPLSLWWKNHFIEASLFSEIKGWSYTPHLTTKQRFSILHDVHHASSYFHICLLQEYLALFPELVSTNPEEERINIPGTIQSTNWSYRIRPSLEELLSHTALIETMQSLITPTS